MKIEKGGRIYTVKENKSSWVMERKIGSVTVSYMVNKKDCPTVEDLKQFIENNKAL